jgi:membrane protein
MTLGNTTSLLKQTFSEWSEDKGPRLGAALAYYAIFSIPPLVLIALAVIGFFYSGDVTGRLQAQLANLIGDDAAKTILTTSPSNQQQVGLLAGLIGVIVLLFGASGVFAELQEALNTIWDVKPKEGTGIKGVIKDRFLSFTMVFGMCFLLLVSLIVSAVVAAMSETMSASIPGGEALGHILELSVSFGVIALLFAMMFKFLPDVDVAWNDVWIGAVVTAFLFTLGKFAIGMYIGKSSIGSAYGAAGSVVILITWVYYSAQILYFGAEFTQVYATERGSHVARKQKTAAEIKPIASRAETPAMTTSSEAPRPVWNYVLVMASSFVTGLLLRGKVDSSNRKAA